MSRKAATPDQSAFLDSHLRPPQTKLVCSLRPSTDLQTIKHLLLCGMNVARIACAFGTQNELELLIQRIREASNITKRLCGIILETHGTSAMVGPVLMTPSKKNPDPLKEPISNNTSSIPTTLSLNNGNINTNAANTTSDDLQVLAQTLSLDLDKLPQNIINNATFAVNNIINDELDNTNDADKEQQKEKIVNDKDDKNQEENKEEKKDQNENEDENSTLMFPLAMSPRTQSSGHHQTNLNLIESSPIQQRSSSPIHNLSYDGDSFLIQPDIYLIKGSTVRIITDRIILGDRKKFSICLPATLTNKLSIGIHIIIHPSIKLEIKSIDNKLHTLTCLVLDGGPLKEYSKVEFPSLKVRRDSNTIAPITNNGHHAMNGGDGQDLTQQDVSDIGFGVQNGVDYILISHVKSIRDINKTKEMLEFQTASMHQMKRNVSYDLDAMRNGNLNSVKQTYIHRTASDASQSNLLQNDDHISNTIKVLAKIEDYQCLNDIYEIINECDGIVIDHISLLHSYSKYVNNDKERLKNLNMNNNNDETEEKKANQNENEDEYEEMTMDKLKEKVTEIIHDMILETRKQAKPFSICCDIQTNLIQNEDDKDSVNISDIEHDLRLLNDVPGIPINANSFLTYDDIISIEYCIAYGCDSISLLSDINRLKQIYTDYYENRNKSAIQLGYNQHDELLYIHALMRSICDVIKKKEISTREFWYQNSKISFNRKLSRSQSNDHLLSPSNKNDDNVDTDSVDSYSDSDEVRKIYEVESIFNSMASSAVKSAYDMNCSLIIVLTQSGRIARIVSKYRPHCTILAITDSEIIAKQCMFISAIFPVLVLNMNGTDSLISRALYIANKYKLIKKKNDKVVVLAGTQSDILDEPCDFIMKLLYVDL